MHERPHWHPDSPLCHFQSVKTHHKPAPVSESTLLVRGVPWHTCRVKNWFHWYSPHPTLDWRESHIGHMLISELKCKNRLLLLKGWVGQGYIPRGMLRYEQQKHMTISQNHFTNGERDSVKTYDLEQEVTARSQPRCVWSPDLSSSKVCSFYVPSHFFIPTTPALLWIHLSIPLKWIFFFALYVLFHLVRFFFFFFLVRVMDTL